MKDILFDFLVYTPMYVTFFWAIVLLMSRPKNNAAKRWLGMFMSAAFLLYLCHAVYFHNQSTLYIYFDSLYTFTSLLVFPLYYLYIKVLCHDGFIRKKDFILFMPAVFFALVSITLYIMMTRQEAIFYVENFLYHRKPDLLNTPLQKLQRGFYLLNRLAFTAQVIYFLIKGSRLVIKYNKRVANFFSNLESKTLFWVNLLLISFVATSLMSIVFNFIGKMYFMDSPFLLMIPSVIFSLLLFAIGVLGYMQNYSVSNLISEEKAEPHMIDVEKNSSELKKRLLELFEQNEVYKNPELRITDISRKLRTNRTYASRLINNEFSCSFSEFVNQYRIRRAKVMLQDKSQNNFTLEYISEQVGFGSLHTFIRVFKDLEGITPGNYRIQHQNNPDPAPVKVRV